MQDIVKNILGVSAGFHDAAVSVLDSRGNIVFAGHSERYSKKKHDKEICQKLLDDISEHEIHHISYYENPYVKQCRRFMSGEGIDWNNLTVNRILKNQFGKTFLNKHNPTVSYHSHHLCHAAAGFQTSSFDKATVVVIDAIGEFETVSIWTAEYINQKAVYKKLWSQRYPHSIGLFYSAATAAVGLKPMDEEYILMGMAAYGKDTYSKLLQNKYIDDFDNIRFKENLHIGFTDQYNSKFNLATSAQVILEKLIKSVLNRARSYQFSNNLVYMGGVSLNCLANRLLPNYFQNIWIMPNPGDAGSSLGAAALTYKKQINWQNAYLGHDISGPYPVDSLINELLESKIVGVANGRAEFGPRALGNRSLLADPRGAEIKDQVNEIKRRQNFRPFAPVILEEYASEFFDMPIQQSRYMQFVAYCKFPEQFPAIVHKDNTSRVQTVPCDNSGIRKLLEKWYSLTGCPMLLNTSLNIRGFPMVNNLEDAKQFQQTYGIKVFS